MTCTAAKRPILESGALSVRLPFAPPLGRLPRGEMYGLIQLGIKAMVVEKFGEEAWQGICAEAGCSDHRFLQHEYYPDQQAVAIVLAAAKALGVEAGSSTPVCIWGACVLVARE